MSSDGAKLVRAVQVGDNAKVKRLLKAKADVNYSIVNESGDTGVTALQCAGGFGNAACWAGDHDRDAREAAARARDAEAFKGGMTVKEINAAFGERAGELKKPAKRIGLIDMGLIHLFMM